MADEISTGRYVNVNGIAFPTFDRQVHSYIVNYIPFNENEQNPDLREHMKKCRKVRRMFQHGNGFHVHCVQMQPGDTPDTFTQYFATQLAGKGVGDLIIIYYHGIAGGADRNYTWKFAGLPHISINAYDFIDQINRTTADGLLLLDCEAPTRVQGKWKGREGNLEIICRSHQVRDVNGRIIRDDFTDFTKVMVTNMAGLLRNINIHGYSGRGAPASVSDVMKGSKLLKYNPLRIWTKRPKRGAQQVIKRIEVCPKEMQRTGGIVFIAKQIQPLPGPGFGNEGGDGDGDGEDGDGDGEDRDGGDVEVEGRPGNGGGAGGGPIGGLGADDDEGYEDSDIGDGGDGYGGYGRAEDANVVNQGMDGVVHDDQRLVPSNDEHQDDGIFVRPFACW